ncbi:MAG: alkaline phosphatase D [Verrucomicrobiales bacterium]|jgi:alkaline phosphatase D
MNPLRLCLTSLFFASIAFGQHDAERNATQAIALGDLEKAEQLLAKSQPDYVAEVEFVRMMIDLKAGETAAAAAHARTALERGLSFDRFLAGPRELLEPFHGTDEFKAIAAEHEGSALLHGPMLGSVTGSSASFWVRTAGASTVKINTSGGVSEAVKTSAVSDYTAVLQVNGLEPGTEYTYEVEIDGEIVPAESDSFSTFPEQGQPAKFKVAFGGGAGFVPKWEYMWDTIGKFEPDALLMLGDNVYIDQPQHTLCQYYCYYRRQARPEWRKLTGTTSVYAIYDDHDFGTNDCVPGPEIDTPVWKREVWNIFRQNWVNPAYGGGEEQPGCWQDFQIGDVHFILVDGRFYRDRKGKTMLGPVQKAWLKETLKNSKGTFKVIASPVPWTEGIKPGSKDPWDGYPEEREEIFSFIEESQIEGVFLIAADRHRTDLRTTKRENGYDLYEFESSRLTNRHTHGVIKTPGLIWGYKDTCSFALMKFDTTAETPEVTFECITIDGEILHTYTLGLDKLKY